jgi:hypothetical protein
METRTQYKWGLKFFLRPLVLWFIVYAIGMAVISAVLMGVGVGQTGRNLAALGLFAVCMWKGGQQARERWPPKASEADILADQDSYTDYESRVNGSGRTAAEFVDALQGNPSVSNVHNVSAAIWSGTRTPEKRDQMWRSVDCEPPEVFDRLFALYEQERDVRLSEAIERLSRDAPAAAAPHAERLFEDFGYAPADAEVDAGDNTRLSNRAALALGHISREAPEIAEEATDEVLSQVESDSPNTKLVLALGELLPHDERAEATVMELRDSHISDVQNAANEIAQYYSRTDRPTRNPYAAKRVLDRFDERSLEEERRTSGGGWEGIGYTCENCGTTLHLDDISGGGQYTCGRCGHVLDDQVGASLEYWDDWE